MAAAMMGFLINLMGNYQALCLQRLAICFHPDNIDSRCPIIRVQHPVVMYLIGNGDLNPPAHFVIDRNRLLLVRICSKIIGDRQYA